MLAKLSVKKPYTVIVAILLVIVLGVISFMNMTTDLLPSMDLPYVMVYTIYTGATPENVESTITRPLEAAFATLTDVKNVTSTSSENLSLVVLEFNSSADMNTAMIEISSEIDQLSGSWDDSVSSPIIMKINPNMLPVSMSTVSLEGQDIYALSDYVNDTLIPAYEAVDGVAQVTASGVVTQQVNITIEQSRIDALNNAILREVDAELADAEQQLNSAQGELDAGSAELERTRKSTLAQIDEALAAIEDGSEQMPAAIEQLTAQRAELAAQLESAKAAKEQMDALVNLSDDEKKQIQQIGQAVAALEVQRNQLQAQLDALEKEGDSESESTAALRQQLSQAQASRAELSAKVQELQAYIQDLQALDVNGLKQTISDLESSIAANETELANIRSQLEEQIAIRDAAQTELQTLNAQIAEMEANQPTDTPTAEVTATPAATESVETATPAATAETTPEVTSGATGEASAQPSTEATTEASAEATIEATVGATNTASAAATAETTPETSASTEATIEASVEATIEATAEAENTQDAQAFALNLNNLLGGAAYAENDTPTLAELYARRENLLATYNSAQQQVESLTSRSEALQSSIESEKQQLADAKAALEEIEAGGVSVQSRIDAARAQMAEANLRIAGLDVEIAAITLAIESQENGTQAEALSLMISALDTQIAEIKESDAYMAYLALANESELNASYAQLESAIAQLEAGISSIDSMLDKLNKGIIPGGMIDGVDEDTSIASAKEQLLSARAQALEAFEEAEETISDGEAALEEAWAEFNAARDEALANAGIDGVITLEVVSGIIAAQNFEMPAGYVSDEDGRYLVSVGNKFATLNELKQVKLFSLGLESIDEVRLLDVAKVEISDNSAELFTIVNGEMGIQLSFEKQSTASTAEVAKNITAESERLMDENPDLKVVEMFNQGDYIDLIVDSVLDNLVSGGALAILVLLLFLMDWRPTLIVAISIPTSVVVAFVAMYFTDITLNIMSLSGLALGVGMLVDNSIVTIENIYRLHDEEGLPLLTSCIRGVNQVSGALFSSTLTTICVFLPVVFIDGMARDLFADMGLTIAFALLASLIVAMTVVPSCAATLFKKSKPKKQRVFGAIQNGYGKLLRGALKAKPLVLIVAVGLLVFTCMQVPNMGISFMPTVNSEQMSAGLSFENVDLTTAQKQEIALNIMDSMMDVKGVTDVSLSSGSSSLMSMMSASGDYSYYMLVDPESGRTNEEIAKEMLDAASEWADGENIILDVQTSTMDMSMLIGSGISIDIRGSEIETLRQAATEVAAICEKVEGAVNIDDGSQSAEPKLAIVVDKDKANDNALTVAQVYQYVAQRLYGSIELTTATLDGREYSIYVVEDRNLNLAPDDLMDMEMDATTATGETKKVRIGDIAHVEYGESLASIQRDNQQRVVSVSFEVADGYSSNLVSNELEELLADYQPPEGCKVTLSGENETVMEFMEDLVLMLIVAVIFIFLIMVAQFQSFKSPIIVMFTIPLAFTGGLLALMLTGLDLSIVAMVGFLVLSGVIVNNGIVFVDSVNQMRIGGMSKRDALIETGRIRLRPILMTALTTILGMSTMAFATGMGAEMMQPMAVVTIGGLIYATLMTLFVVPVLYDLFNGEKMKAREIEMMKEAAGMKREGFDDDAPIPSPQPAAAAPVANAAPVAGNAAPATPPQPAAAAPAANAAPVAGNAAPESAKAPKRVRIKL